MVATEEMNLSKEAMLYGHLTKKYGTVIHFDQIVSCFKNALWKTRSLLLCNNVYIMVEYCLRLGLSELQLYFGKTEMEEGEKETEELWKRNRWLMLFHDTSTRDAS